MSLSDTIDAIIKESTSVERELRWFLSALPAIVSTEVMGYGDPVSSEEQDQRQVRRDAIADATIQNQNLMLGAMQHVPLNLFSGAYESTLSGQQAEIVNADRATTRMLMASHTKLGENNEEAKRLLAKASSVSAGRANCTGSRVRFVTAPTTRRGCSAMRSAKEETRLMQSASTEASKCLSLPIAFGKIRILSKVSRTISSLKT